MKTVAELNPENDARVALQYAEAIIDTMREPFLVLDKTLRIISANQSFYAKFNVAKNETVDRRLSTLGNGQWKIPRLLHLLKEILPEKTVVKDYVVEHKFKSIGFRVMNVNAHTLCIPPAMTTFIAGGVRS